VDRVIHNHSLPDKTIDIFFNQGVALSGIEFVRQGDFEIASELRLITPRAPVFTTFSSVPEIFTIASPFGGMIRYFDALALWLTQMAIIVDLPCSVIG
jgi:hypothetical protein